MGFLCPHPHHHNPPRVITLAVVVPEDLLGHRFTCPAFLAADDEGIHGHWVSLTLRCGEAFHGWMTLCNCYPLQALTFLHVLSCQTLHWTLWPQNWEKSTTADFSFGIIPVSCNPVLQSLETWRSGRLHSAQPSIQKTLLCFFLLSPQLLWARARVRRKSVIWPWLKWYLPLFICPVNICEAYF